MIYNDQNFDYEGTTSYQVLLGTGNPVKPVEPLASVNLTQEISTPFTGDFNGDGKLDFATNVGTIFFGNDDGTFYVSQQFLLDGGPLLDNQVSMGDFNNDAIPDLLFCSGDSLTPVIVALGQAGGQFSPPIGLQTNQIEPGSCAIADFNGDGNLDVVGVDSGSKIGIFFGKGDGSFREPVIYDSLLFESPMSVVSADFNGDGVPDFAVSTSFNTTAFFLGEGDGKFKLGGEIVGAGATLMGHFHGNPAAPPLTKPDLVVADEHTNFMSVLINTTK